MRWIFHTVYVLICGIFLYTIGYAQSDIQSHPAVQTLQQSIDSIIAILQDPKWSTKQGQKELYPQLRTKVRSMFDFRVIASQIVGSKWDSFTSTQQEAFIAVFADILEYTYASSFTNYSGQSVHIERSRINKSGTQAEITTKIDSPDGKITNVIYRLVNTQNGWKIYNVIVENINLIASYKTQLKELLLHNNADVIIERLRKRAESLSIQK